MVRWVLAASITALMTAGGAQAASLVATIDVANQTMTVERHGRVIHHWSVSTARPGFVTPRGEFRPYRIHRMWHSRTYDNAPMPFAVFYDRGWAVHGTSAVSRLGQPASHGCVRLANENARIFYELVREIGAGNTRIIVTDEAAPSLSAELRR
ncbi:L,D-transpeptidase family protein [Chelativorans sp. ZYF759]|uniref:L,D-transpeptidase n=1 Tax=Chelativorans sp. ZYF759 TaxID=2692213 RepID=UPI00145DEE27|nr:L,D-transpeptidase [Chelativorans sp. ZYF759]NMG38775.1 L,D-transpeptidase family protein [Chelativorans sp. ZYF759]